MLQLNQELLYVGTLSRILDSQEILTSDGSHEVVLLEPALVRWEGSPHWLELLALLPGLSQRGSLDGIRPTVVVDESLRLRDAESEILRSLLACPQVGIVLEGELPVSPVRQCGMRLVVNQPNVACFVLYNQVNATTVQSLPTEHGTFDCELCCDDGPLLVTPDPLVRLEDVVALISQLVYLLLELIEPSLLKQLSMLLTPVLSVGSRLQQGVYPSTTCQWHALQARPKTLHDRVVDLPRALYE